MYKFVFFKLMQSKTGERKGDLGKTISAKATVLLLFGLTWGYILAYC